MNIGIFGDSYASRHADPTAWWKLLSSEHDHTTTSFGWAGSSILYSVDQILSHHDQFDWNIWCMTCPGRFSFHEPGSDEWIHSTNWMDVTGKRTMCEIPDHLDRVIQTCQDYLKYIFDVRLENIVGQALATHFCQMIPNLTIIPCFKDPLLTDFDLFTLCCKEVETVMPGKELFDIYQQYQDIRVCHLTEKNNRILAKLVNDNLNPGIFQTSYDQFSFDNISINQVFTPFNR